MRGVQLELMHPCPLFRDNISVTDCMPWQANAVMKRRLPALSAGTRVSFVGNCKKQKPQID